MKCDICGDEVTIDPRAIARGAAHRCTWKTPGNIPLSQEHNRLRPAAPKQQPDDAISEDEIRELRWAAGIVDDDLAPAACRVLARAIFKIISRTHGIPLSGDAP